MSDYIKSALEKNGQLPEKLLLALENMLELSGADTTESTLKYYDENEVSDGDIVFELVYRVKKIVE